MNTKTMIVCALMLLAAPAVVQAAPFVLLEKENESETSSITAKLEANRDLGRAWIEIQISDPGYSGEDAIAEVVRRPIEGLSYDQANNRIVYTSGGRSVVCAEEKQFLFQKFLKNTGDCPIVISSENRTLDDGFHVSSQVVSKIVFDPQA